MKYLVSRSGENTPKRLAILEYQYTNNVNGHEQDTPRKTTTVHDEGRNQKKKKGGGDTWSMLLQVGERSTRSLRTTKCRKKCTVYTRLTATVEIAPGEERGKK